MAADMIVELEKVEFLDIGDLSNCQQVGADGPLATISADVTAGSNKVDYDTNCDLRDISQLITRLFELSGFTTWASHRSGGWDYRPIRVAGPLTARAEI